MAENRFLWGDAVTGGIVAGLVFLVLEMVMVPVFGGGSPWGPPRMIAGIVMGQGVVPPPGTFALVPVVVAVIIHMILSIFYALVISFIIRKMNVGLAILTGAAGGFVLYLLNFYVFTAIWPWFANARNWITIFTHIVFGLLAAWVFTAMAKEPTAKMTEDVA
ncbi:MAG: hypothetical protein R3338_01265 [Thermoanaerobaculia bacterium]|nr:hypothetical protein [Thermoanaerobaculia bacterium]